jgi:putative membrane protein
MIEAVRAGIGDIELSRMALERAEEYSVKSFARRVLDERTQADIELKKIASDRGLILPSDADMDHQSLKSALSGLSGGAFDEAFMKAMVDRHRTAVDVFRRATHEVKNNELRLFAMKTLPVLERHLDAAEETGARVGLPLRQWPQNGGGRAFIRH